MDAPATINLATTPDAVIYFEYGSRTPPLQVLQQNAPILDWLLDDLGKPVKGRDPRSTDVTQFCAVSSSLQVINLRQVKILNCDKNPSREHQHRQDEPLEHGFRTRPAGI